MSQGRIGRRAGLASLIVLSASAGAFAQAPALAALEVDVLAVDGAGRPVQGLAAADFDLRQQGRGQPVLDVRYVAPADAPRTVVFLIDDLALSIDSVSWVRKGIESFIDESMGAGDRVAILETHGDSSHPLTGDKKLLRESVQRVRYNTLERSSSFSYDDLRHRFSLFGTLDSLHSTLDSLAKVPGRKSLVLFSEGIELGSRFLDPAVRDSLEKIVDAANRASVVIYAIDAHGLPPAFSPAWYAPRRFYQQAGLEMLADDTGGLFLKNTEVGTALRRVMAGEGGYYVIRWADPTGSPKSREVDVRVKREGVKARARREVFADTAGGI